MYARLAVSKAFPRGFQGVSGLGVGVWMFESLGGYCLDWSAYSSCLGNVLMDALRSPVSAALAMQSIS